ncbi:MAG: hypothetical protein ACU84H_02285 [Gammaproteobacteria bacterium]
MSESANIVIKIGAAEMHYNGLAPTVSLSAISEAIEQSDLIPSAKKAIVRNIILSLALDNAIKVTELISKIKGLFADDNSTCDIIISIVISVAKL